MNESWVCYLEIEDDGTEFRQLPAGMDTVMRLELEKLMKKYHMKIKVLSTCWGNAPNKLDQFHKAMHEINKGFEPASSLLWLVPDELTNELDRIKKMFGGTL